MFDEDQINYAEKIRHYQQTLDSLIKQLAVKRTEMSTLAKQTVEDLESSIPELEEKAHEEQQVIDKLDKIIDEKTKIANKEKESLVLHYDKLEAVLKEEYTIELDKVELREKECDKRDEQYVEKSSSLDLEMTSRENDVKRARAVLAEDQQALESRKQALAETKEDFEAECNN